MKLVTYRTDVEGPARLGVIESGTVVDVAEFGLDMGLDFPDRMLDFIDRGPNAVAQLHDALREADGDWGNALALPIETVTVLAPIPRPRKNIFGIGLNYLDHITESARALDTDDALPREPVVFSKPPTAVVGPGDPVRHDGNMTQQLDWEVELAVIIGTTARRIPRAGALGHVFGYSVMIDVSARDNRRAGQWIFSKGMDTYAPFGPCIVTADGQWRGKAAIEHGQDAVQGGGADQRSVARHYTGTGRHHRIGHPRRGGCGTRSAGMALAR